MKRHRDALFIVDPGACNPSGIAHSIIEACREMRAEPNHKGTDEIRKDPAIRLMVYQLAYLTGVTGTFDDFEACMKECKAKEAKPTEIDDGMGGTYRPGVILSVD